MKNNLWIKCQNCSSPIFGKIFEENFKVCDKCNYHHKLSFKERLKLLIDPETFQEVDRDISPLDPLNFGEDYLEKIKKDQEKNNLKDAVITGSALIGNHPAILGIMDFNFRGGSMGSVVGEKIVRAFELACKENLPVIMFSSSGGARMQEGMLSLMQMAKTVLAVNKLAQNKCLYISVLTDPTTAGVAASFASLGDIILAEPQAIIGFSGKRVIEQTINQKLPQGFQTSEFYLKHGFIDKVIERKELREILIKILNFYKSDK